MNLTQLPRWLRDHYLATGLLMLSGLGQSLFAATIIVNSLEDTTLADGQCTLREALNNANQDTAGVGDCIAGSGDDVIDLTGLEGTITLSAQLEITSNLILEGPGAEKLTLSGDDKYRVFWVNSSTPVEIKGVTITRGSAEYGGGIYNSGILTVINSTLSGNSASGGGGIANSGALIIINSTLLRNSAFSGGGVNNIINRIVITNSTLSENSAKWVGGGIYNQSIGTNIITVTNSTLSGNSAKYGGGIKNYNFLTLTNTIIANSIEGGDCDGFESEAIKNTLIEDGSCNPTWSGDPKLGILANNGGPTFTHALLRGSPAIDAGDDTICAAEPVNGLDQRGVPRFGSSAGNHCDIGAYEYQKPALATLESITIESNAIRWETLAEQGTQGFYLWQAEPVVAGTCETFTNPQLVISKPISAKGSEVQGEAYQAAVAVNLNGCYGIQEIPSGQIYITPRPGRNKWIGEQWLTR
ncbi:polymorphic outer membrane protein [Thioploca ingrica]|uniref:Polymorphic outer membrane protein n=1 Tax=Thioploca ingrica TaxID=40754 RepID=A0A090AMX8_9GAMM|nr:polymorphic outer membrane protein [Thioploca ingrica]